GAERDAGKPGDRPDEVAPAVGCRDFDDARAALRGNDARDDAHLAPKMRQRGLLRLELRAIFPRVRDLEHQAFALRRLEQEVLVALAGQDRGGGVEAVVRADKLACDARVETRSLVELRKRHT